MAKQLELEVANFVCRFGETSVLADRLDDVVIPAFFSYVVRNSRGTKYFFTRQELSYLRGSQTDSMALSCRFIKNTTLKRYQVYSEKKGIIHDEGSLPSAPSAVAILLLKSHRLLYVKEVPGAPSIGQFGSTFKYMMREIVMSHRDDLYHKRQQSGEKVTRKQVAADVPIPNVDVVPIPASESLKEFLERFEVLSTLKVELAPTNNEVDNEDFFKKLRGTKQEVGSSKTRLVHTNPAGLDKDGVFEHVEAAKQGNAYVTMIGKDEGGDDLKGDNTDFSVRAAIGEKGMDYLAVVDEAFSQFSSLVRRGVVQLGQASDDITRRLQASMRRFREDNDE